jgi:hypothetical protein
MRIIAAIASALLAAAALAHPSAQPASVTLPLTEYTELQKARENASAAVIDTLTLTGTFLGAQTNESLTYQGLPAKFELPDGHRYTNFHEQLLAAEHPRVITVVLLSMTFVTWAAIVVTVIAAVLLWLDRETIKTAFRARTAEAMAPPATATV